MEGPTRGNESAAITPRFDAQQLANQTSSENNGSVQEGLETSTPSTKQASRGADVQFHNFETFKNRYSEDQGHATIEVLYGHPQLYQDVEQESDRRERSKDKKVHKFVPPRATTAPKYHWIQRVRFQSPHLITLLSRLSGNRNGWATDRPMVFFTPFSAFHYLLDKVRTCRDILKERCGNTETRGRDAQAKRKFESPDTLEGDSDASGDESDTDNDDDLHFKAKGSEGFADPASAIEGLDSPTALKDIEIYIRFVERHIEPQWTRASGTAPYRVRFNDLPMIFQPGGLLYVRPSDMKAEDTGSTEDKSDSQASKSEGAKSEADEPKMYQTAWRIYRIAPSPIADDTPNDTDKSSNRVLQIDAYYIDYNGAAYVTVVHSFFIRHFENDRDITKLNVFPMRFAKDANKMRDGLKEQGRRFLEVTKQKHLYYSGWTFAHEPIGTALKTTVEHIDGDIMIDFREGYKSGASSLGSGPETWDTALNTCSHESWVTGDDDMMIKVWKPLSKEGRMEITESIWEQTMIEERYAQR